MAISDECVSLNDVDSPLVCHLPAGHEGGWHYDADENITWKVGKPDD